MKLKNHLKILFTSLFIFSFLSKTEAQNSDKKAIEIAKKTMQAMGGVENWNRVHYIKWDFAQRTLHWDKWSGDVRVESKKDDLILFVNINTNKGKAFKKGELISDKKETQKLIKKAKNWWINDSYWLTMPWKLLDPGVTLTYSRIENNSEVLQMTFENVGNTPINKYEIFIDKKSNLVIQWSFFKNFNDTTPKFTKPWDNYQKLNNVLLSFNRSDFGPKNVVCKQEINTKIFSEL